MLANQHVNVDKIIREQTHDHSSLRQDSQLHSFAYGGRFTAEPTPKFEIPEQSMPANVAYQVIHDEMILDGNPALNLATFVTTWMEPEVDKLISETANKNFIDCDEYPQVQIIHSRCVSMMSHLFNAPKSDGDASAMGTCTIGSSEAFMLAGLAMKFAWRKRRQAKGLPTDKPNIVLGHNAQVALEKFALYFDVEARLVEVSEKSHYALDVDEALKRVDENTIGVVAILGSTFTGHFEPVKELNDRLVKINEKTGWDVPIHVDGASGAFVAPFLYPDLVWDFRLPLVCSINVSGHKYGLVYPGVGWCIWRSKEYLPEELIFHIDYLGGSFPSFTLNFSKSSSMVVAQYYNFLRLGREGYTAVMQNCQANAIFLQKCLLKTEYFHLVSDASTNLPLVACRLNAKQGQKYPFNETDISHRLRQKGWIVPAYPLPKGAADVRVLRIVVRESHSADLIEQLVRDLVWTVEILAEERAQYGALTAAATPASASVSMEKGPADKPPVKAADTPHAEKESAPVLEAARRLLPNVFHRHHEKMEHSPHHHDKHPRHNTYRHAC